MCLEAGKRFAKADEVFADPARANNALRRGCKLSSADACLALAERCNAAPEHCKENEAAIARARACKLGNTQACGSTPVDKSQTAED